MVAALYQELSPQRQRAFDAHLASCSQCATEYQEMSWTLGVMDQREATAPDAAYWKGYWNQLSDRLEPEGRRTVLPDWRNWFPPLIHPVRPAWISVAAAVLLVATGIFIGRTTLLRSPSPGIPVQATVFDPSLIAEFNELA
ncbi:MAG: zf-HC2 domain-containing protein, partial [Fidelibacterota bacterium]